MKGVIGGQQYAVISSAAAFIDDRLDAKKQLMASLANDLPAAARGDPRLVQAYLEAHTGLRTEFLNLTAFGRDGRLLASLRRRPPASRSAAPASSISKRPWRARRASFRRREERAVGRPGSAGHRAAARRKGNVVMVLAGAIELRRAAFLRQIDLLKPGKTGFVFIMTTAACWSTIRTRRA